MKPLVAQLLLAAVLRGQGVTAVAQTPVAAVEPNTGRSTESLRMTGNLVARQASGLSTQESELVSVLHVDVGDTIEQGDLLVELDAGLVEQDVARAEAAALLDEARRLTAEARRLGDDRFLPETELRARASSVSKGCRASTSAAGPSARSAFSSTPAPSPNAALR